MIKTKIDLGFDPLIIRYNKHAQKAKSVSAGSISLQVEGTFSDVITMPYISEEESYPLVERMAKALLWKTGGFRLFASDERVVERLKAEYSLSGARSFDYTFMGDVYRDTFEVAFRKAEDMEKVYNPVAVSKTISGKVVGMDAGGSEKKVTAILNGEVIESARFPWKPKFQTGDEYLFNELVSGINWGKEKLGGLDKIGVSTAGIVVNKRLMASSLFYRMTDDSKKRAADVYERVEKEFGTTLCVANDGDVSAIGAFCKYDREGILAISLGTSTAGGFVSPDGHLNGLINELAFVPIDFNKSGLDEWSGDFGCGVKYLSQDAVIKLFEMMGNTAQGETPSEKIQYILKNCKGENLTNIYHDIGVYLGYAIGFYSLFYDFAAVFVQGGVTSGEFGEIIRDTANKVIKENNFNKEVILASREDRNLGQAVAAAYLK